MKYPTKDQKRSILIDKLRKEGNFIVNRPVKNVKYISPRTYLPCVFCKGFYEKNNLWRHARVCVLNPKNAERFRNLMEDPTMTDNACEPNVANDVGTYENPEDNSDPVKSQNLEAWPVKSENLEACSVKSENLEACDCPVSLAKDDYPTPQPSTGEPQPQSIAKKRFQAQKAGRAMLDQFYGESYSAAKNSSINSLLKKRPRWTEHQKQTVREYFRSQIENCVAPRKSECVRFKNVHRELFKDKSWVKIKVFVYNEYKRIYLS